MGPRFSERGKSPKIAAFVEGEMLQWGRASMSAERSAFPANAAESAQLQWGRMLLMSAESRLECK